MGAAEGKFKEGDWVRATHTDYPEDIGVGEAFKVGASYGHGVEPEGEHSNLFFCNWELEPWTPKVGERVRVPVEANSVWTGDGEVVEFRASFGTYTIHMHTGYCAGDSGDFFLKEIEPLPVASEAQPAAPAPLTIRAGKFYKTRDGRKVGPMLVYINNKSEWMIEVGDGNLWTAEGKHKQGCRTSRGEDFMHDGGDLIAEWPADTAASDTTTTNVAATVDALDEEYGPGATVEKPKFKVGDRVRVVKVGFSGHRRSIGEEFTLSQLMPGNSTYGAFWTTSDGPDFYLDEIELVARPTPAIVCLIDSSSPLPATRPRVHDSVEAAGKEAARLAGLHKGQEFGVFAMTGAPHKVEKTYEHEWQRLAAAGERIRAVKALSAATGLDLHSARDAIDGWKRRAA